MHELDLDRLLPALNQQAQLPRPPAPAIPLRSVERPLYPPFLRTSLLLALLAGFGLITAGLFGFVLGGPAAALVRERWLALIQAHGAVQLLGWVGLFALGVAYQVLPRMRATRLRAPRLARLSLPLVAAGLLVRLFGQVGLPLPAQAWALVLASLLGLAGLGLFAWVAARTILGSDQPPALPDAYLLAALGWVVVGALSTLALAAESLANDSGLLSEPGDSLVVQIWLLGFLGQFILGVGARTLSACLGRRPPVRALLVTAWALWNGGLALMVGALVAPLPVAAGATLRLLAAVAYVAGLRLWQFSAPPPGTILGGHEALIRAAFVWLLVGAGLAAWGSFAPGPAASAARHAWAVGFVSQMVVGVALRILPVFSGRLLAWRWVAPALLLLLNGAAALRVAAPLWLVGQAQITTVALSGLLGTAAIALFALALWPLLAPPRYQTNL